MNQPVVMVAACLPDVSPDGAATRVSYGLRNPPRRDRAESAEPLTRLVLPRHHPAERSGAGVPVGHRIRLSLSSARPTGPSPGRRRSRRCSASGGD
ncbi:CocE/NonD family hydrolase C-terminal non-catalytic domain-containing protein [Streptomyces sp. NPDC087263]|uniref:CocE/NonD family hydrolase C-terminal non-catalytic domain-containing protein n=1 Tax=Streptomyces sp. NPDC087263 TaxID=3365773 RepID=UPI0038226892